MTRSASSGSSAARARQGALGLADRAHLLPVAEQHDRDQQGELPPEVEIEQTELVAALARKATLIASEISSIMPGVRARISSRPPFRKTVPP